MNLQDQVIYRCIHAACAQPLPRKVNFCPYCGTGQHDGVINHMHVARPVQAEYVVPAATPQAVPVAQPAPAPAPAAAPAPAPAKAAPRPAPPSGPPKREPVRLRYWLMALAGLWLIWIYAKPSASKIEDRVDSAITASEECRLNDAQSELIALRMTKATPDQLKRLQAAMKKAEPICEKKKLRAKAWTDTTTAVDAALAAGDAAKAQARLAVFTKRWGEDDDTRTLRDRIADQRASEIKAAPAPLPVPAPVVAAPARSSNASQSARNLIDEAERAIKEGNYKSASDKLETCITMVDAGNRECAAFKVHADRLQRDLQRCLSGGGEWYNERCH